MVLGLTGTMMMNEHYAEAALRQLLLAYARADEELGSASIDWGDLDQAFELAREALPGVYLELVEEMKLNEND
jgi:hypothetical protein